jgi:hypothetical protein
MQKGRSMAVKNERLPHEFRCANGHHFPKKVWKKVHYDDQTGQRLFARLDHLEAPMCPVRGCGAPAVPVGD